MRPHGLAAADVDDSRPSIGRTNEPEHPALALTTPQRITWSGEPVNEAELFRIHKLRCGRQVEAVCELWTHCFGWELRLIVDGQLQRSEVCRSQDAVLKVSENWKTALVERGWA